MKVNRGKRHLKAAALIIVVAAAYIILSTRPVAAPSELEPLDTLAYPPAGAETVDSRNTPAHDVVGPGTRHSFVGPSKYGYYDNSGVFSYVADRQTAVANGGFALDDCFLLQSDSSNGCIWLSDFEEGRTVRVPLEGVPYVSERRIFLIRKDQMAVAELNRDGTLRWSREFGSVLTSVSTAERVSLWGFLDGAIEVVGEDGALTFRLDAESVTARPGYRGVYGSAISRDGSMIALLYGLAPQYLLVYEKRGEQYLPVHSRRLNADKRNTQPLMFADDGSALLVASGDGLIYYNRQRRKSAVVAAGRDLFSKSDVACKIVRMDRGQFAVVTAAGGQSVLMVVAGGLCSAMIPAPDASDVGWRDGVLSLATISGISRFIIKGKAVN